MGDVDQKSGLNKIEPCGTYVLILPDSNKSETSGGIILPDELKIPVITGRILAIGPDAAALDGYPLKEYMKVIYLKANGIPVDLETYGRDDKPKCPMLVPVTDIVARYSPSEESTKQTE